MINVEVVQCVIKQMGSGRVEAPWNGFFRSKSAGYPRPFSSPHRLVPLFLLPPPFLSADNNSSNRLTSFFIMSATAAEVRLAFSKTSHSFLSSVIFFRRSRISLSMWAWSGGGLLASGRNKTVLLNGEGSRHVKLWRQRDT